MADITTGRVRINISESVKGVQTVDFTVEVGDDANADMKYREEIAWASVDRMLAERDNREWSKGSV